MAEIRVRPARPGDAEALARLHVANWLEAYEPLLPAVARGRFEVAERLEHWRRVLAGAELPTILAEAEPGGELVGFVSWRVDPDDPEVEALHVAAAWRGRAIGRRLLELARLRLVASGAERPHLWVLERNQPSRAFYEAAGWAWNGDMVERSLGGFPDLPVVTELRYVWTASRV